MSENRVVPEVIEVRLPSRLELLSVLHNVAATLCERMEFDEQTCSEVIMSVVEAGTNAIQHGHGRDPSRVVDTRFHLFPDRLEVEVHDSGPGFDLGSVNGDATSPEHLLDTRGRGIFIMRACMDRVEYEFTDGTRCRLVKNRRPAAAETG